MFFLCCVYYRWWCCPYLLLICDIIACDCTMHVVVFRSSLVCWCHGGIHSCPVRDNTVLHHSQKLWLSFHVASEVFTVTDCVANLYSGYSVPTAVSYLWSHVRRENYTAVVGRIHRMETNAGCLFQFLWLWFRLWFQFLGLWLWFQFLWL